MVAVNELSNQIKVGDKVKVIDIDEYGLRRLACPCGVLMSLTPPYPKPPTKKRAKRCLTLVSPVWLRSYRRIDSALQSIEEDRSKSSDKSNIN